VGVRGSIATVQTEQLLALSSQTGPREERRREQKREGESAREKERARARARERLLDSSLEDERKTQVHHSRLLRQGNMETKSLRREV
jgi:hypothetical protein